MASRTSKYNYEAKEKHIEHPKQKVKTKKRLKFTGFLILIVLALIIYLFIQLLLRVKISNIYIKGNKLYSDQEIIEFAKISNYPSIIKNNNYIIEKRLNKNKYIQNSKVTIKNIREIHIKVEENKPIFYNASISETVLQNGKTTKRKFNVPILLNYVPDKVYEKFIKNMGNLKEEVLIRISEIKYEPNDVDEELFTLIMNDDNLVIVNNRRFKNLNNYVSIIKNFKNQKGTLHLDSGQYFDVNKKQSNE